MKRRIVIEVSMADLKSRSKAMKIAVGVLGVESAAITGPDRNQVEVIGDGIDAVDLTKLIRKNVAYAVLVSVGEVKPVEAAAQQPPPPKPAAEPAPQQVVVPFQPPASYYDGYWNYPPRACDVRDDPSCSIM